MGFLNHATNNIIIDAVLTERGRELLSQNNGSFEITSFTFGDDEVDYSLIKKYGIAIGKEKIEKNTPIYEANPNENYALKHPLITFQNPVSNLRYIPYLVWSNKPTNLSYLKVISETGNTNVDINQLIQIKSSISVQNPSFTLDESITDREFIIKLNNDLLKISGQTSFIDIDINNIATYRLNSDVVTSVNGGNPEFINQVQLQFSIYSAGITTSDTFQKYGSPFNSSIIKTYVQIIGKYSGSSLVIPVTIQRTLS